MKQQTCGWLLSGLLAVTMATTTFAVPISIVGDVSFTGEYTVDNANLLLATKFTSFSNVIVADPNGAYAGTEGAPVTFTAPLMFASPTLPSVLWTFDFGGNTYELSMLTLTVPFKTKNILVMEGEGIARITGYEDTPGYWNLTANRAGASFSFSSSASVIPEPTSFMLTGLGLVAAGLLRRRLRHS